jgi:putative ABC transport system permease protein
LLRLFSQFILRPLVANRVRTATTVIGIALGIAVVIAIQLTNESSVRGFSMALETVAGQTSVEVVGSGVGIDETLLPSLGALREFGLVSPVIEGSAVLVVEGEGFSPRQTAGAQAPALPMTRRPATEAVRILGVDILRDQPFRNYQLVALAGDDPAEAKASALQLLKILTDQRSVVITEKLARRRGYAVGDEIRFMIGDRVGDYIVRALLKDEGPARMLDGNFVLMDIAAAQLAFDRLGRVDRIDVLLPDGSDLTHTLDRVAGLLPPALHVQRPTRRGEQVETMLAAFHMNLTALSWIALIVGLFLVYNTVTISVIARREEIGTLRALGVTRLQVLLLFLSEAAVLAVAGTALGLILARLLADATVALTSATVRTLYIAAVAAPPDLNWSHVAIAIAIGLPLSLLAAAVPALEASGVPPTAAIRGHDTLEMRTRISPASLLAPAIVLAMAVALAQLGPVNGKPYFGYVSSLAIVIGAALLVPAIMFGLGRLSRNLLRRRLGVEGLLAHANLSAAINRLSISVAALAMSLSMMVAIAIMIGSFRDTVVYWLGQTLHADLFIGPGVRPTVGSEQTLSPDVIERVRRHPAVDAVDWFRNVDLTYNGNLTILGASTFDVVAAHGGLLFKSAVDPRQAILGAIGKDAVIISEPFANRYGKEMGDTLTLDTAAGAHDFVVNAVYYDYSNDRGVIIMDRGTFAKYYGDLPPSGIAAFLKPDADADKVRSEILASLDQGHQAFIYTNKNLRTEVLRVFDSTFAITYALEIIAIVVAMLGVAGTLLTLVLERRRELSLLRLTGADRRQVRRMVVIEAALVGAVSQGIGLAVGFALSTVLIYVINVQSFGWTIQFHVPTAFLIQATVVVIIATSIAGIYPARRAAQLVLTHDE